MFLFIESVFRRMETKVFYLENAATNASKVSHLLRYFCSFGLALLHAGFLDIFSRFQSLLSDTKYAQGEKEVATDLLRFLPSEKFFFSP